MRKCLACKLNRNPSLVPGGRITESKYWIVEPCLGPYGEGTLVIKTRKHKEQFSECTRAELLEFAQLLKRTHQALEITLRPENIYISKWGEETKHLHILVQPIFRTTKQRFKAKGPALQSEMVKRGKISNPEKIRKIAKKLKTWFTEKHR